MLENCFFQELSGPHIEWMNKHINKYIDSLSIPILKQSRIGDSNEYMIPEFLEIFLSQPPKQ